MCKVHLCRTCAQVISQAEIHHYVIAYLPIRFFLLTLIVVFDTIDCDSFDVLMSFLDNQQLFSKNQVVNYIA